MRADLHTHSTYSDGAPLPAMIGAAEAAGLDALGVTDHCIVPWDDFGRREKYDLVETYPRRREAIDRLRRRTSLSLYDAAEVSYAPDAEAETRAFLAEADFAYTIGSVHFAGAFGYTSRTAPAESDRAVRETAVDAYYDAVVAAIESGLFDVLGHLDLPERRPTFRGLSTREHYERVAAALAGSDTVPEINAGRVHRGLERLHPDPALLDCFRAWDVAFVCGTDSHGPAELTARVPALREHLKAHDVPTRDPVTVLS